MKSKTDLVMLLDFYGNLLGDHGRNTMIDFAERDLSISEIATKNNVSRQAVLDTLKKQEEKLNDFEKKLQLVARFEQVKQKLAEVANHVDEKTRKEIDSMLDML